MIQCADRTPTSVRSDGSTGRRGAPKLLIFRAILRVLVGIFSHPFLELDGTSPEISHQGGKLGTSKKHQDNQSKQEKFGVVESKHVFVVSVAKMVNQV